jgi:hypothetical protein
MDSGMELTVKPMDTRNAILNRLSREWEMTGPPGILDISDIVIACPAAPSETLEELRQLFAEGLVDMNSLKTAAYLTPEGHEIAT